MPNFKTATKDDALKTGFIFVKDSASQNVKKIATVCEFQVGLTNLPALFTVTGDIAVNGGDITTSAATFNLVNAASTINLGSTAVARSINIGTGAAAQIIAIGTGGASNFIDIGNFTAGTLTTIYGPAVRLYSNGGTITIDSNANGGTVNIDSQGFNSTINVGTGAAIKTTTVGSTNTTSTTTIQGGTNGITLSTGTVSGIAGNIQVGNSTDTYSVNVGLQGANTALRTQTINLGHYSASGGSKNVNIRGDTVTIGDTGGSVTIGRLGAAVSFPGDITVTGDITGDITVTGDAAINGGDVTTTSATFNLANEASTLNLGTTGIVRTVNIGTGTGAINTNAQTINIGTFSSNSATIRIGNYNSTPASVTTIHGDTLNLNTSDTNGTTNICASAASLGFFGATASTQYTTTGTTTGFTAGTGTAARVDSTYTGNNGTKAYTVGDIVRALKSYGLLDVS